jgi:signal transduction histidine kinase/DNA-binding NarL/FixJ family response regulator
MGAVSRPPKRSPAALLALAVACVAVYGFAAVELFRDGEAARDLGFVYGPAADGWVVSSVAAGGAAAGRLRVGDRIVAIDGDREPAYGLVWVALRRIPPGTPFTLRVAGPRGERDVVLRARLERTTAALATGLPYFLVGLSFLVVGLAVAAARPGLRIARLLVVFFLVASIAFLSQALGPMRDLFGGAALAIYFLSQQALLGAFGLLYAFYHRFPDGRPKSRASVGLEYVVAAFGALVAGMLALLQWASLPSALRPFAAGPWLFRLLGPFNVLFRVFLVTALAGGLTILVRTWLTVTEPDLKRRAKWAVYGTLLGLLPDVIANVALAGRSSSFSGGAFTPPWYLVLAGLFFTALPLSFGYAVVKDRLFDIEVVVRRGLQYFLAKNALRVLVVLPLLGLAWALFQNREVPLSRLVLENSRYVSLLAVAVLMLRYRGQIAAAIDRRFFREAYDRERVLAGLAERIRQTDTDRPGTLPEIAMLVMREVETALHPERSYLVFRPGDDGAPRVYANGPDASALEGSVDALASLWARAGLPWRSQTTEEIPADERGWLHANAVDLVVPVSSVAQRVHGFVLLGERRSETPYTATDRRLLEAIAVQVAAAYETFLLREQKERLAEKVAELEVLERRASEANRAKSVFLANMSHELRTPLNGILGFAQLMERRRGRDPEDRESLAMISESGEHLLGLIDDVLSLSKIEAGHVELTLEPFDPGALVNAVLGVVSPRAVAKEIALSLEAAELPRAVVGDERKLRQILLNLLSNAVRLTSRGRVVLRARWKEGRGVFEVEDTGPGIREADLGKLFQPFTQTETGAISREGTGLGLALSRQLARLMGGDITLTSEYGVGSTFRIETELREAEPFSLRSADTRRVVGLEPDGEAPRILVVDDLAQNRLVLTRLLGSVGFTVREASNGEEAVQTWRAFEPRLVFMDKRMAGIDGLEATRRIREEERASARPRTAIVALTASAMEHERGEILASGCDAFVAKPYREATIFEKIAELVGTRYVYEDDAVQAREGVAAIDPARLARIPEDVRAELYDGFSRGDFEAAERAAKRVRPLDGALAEALRAEAHDFRADEALAALASAARKEPGGAA